jgi:hypothetical protein
MVYNSPRRDVSPTFQIKGRTKTKPTKADGYEWFKNHQMRHDDNVRDASRWPGQKRKERGPAIPTLKNHHHEKRQVYAMTTKRMPVYKCRC